MARRVFFSFHYDDVTRANVVRNSDQIMRRYEPAARFHDKSLWEEAKKQGALAIKRMINGGLNGSSVTCVLIGQSTWSRRWVRYEILKSLVRGNGILGVNIHDVGFSPKEPIDELVEVLTRPPAPTRTPAPWGSREALVEALLQNAPQPFPIPDSELEALLDMAPPSTRPGPNPLEYLGYIVDRARGSLRVQEIGPNGNWRASLDLPRMQLGALSWLPRDRDAENLANLFRVYDWKAEDGAHNLPDWIEAAARQVGR